MGNNLSFNKIGGETNNDFKNTIKTILDQLLNQHMEQFLDKTFCKKTKLFLKNHVFMKHAEEDIKGLSGEVFIGHEISDLNDKVEICNKLSSFYLKKVNLVSSIYYIVNFINDKINKIENGPLCFKENKYILSDIDYTTQLDRSQILNFNDNKELKIPNKYKINFDDEKIRKDAYNKFLITIKKKGIDNKLSEKITKKLLITELYDKDKCINEGGKWITKIEEIINNNLIPDPILKNFDKKTYNTYYYNTIQNLKNITNEKITNLINILNKVIEEKIVEINGEKKKKYEDKSITQIQLDNYIKQTKENIQNILVEISYVIFLVYNNSFITKSEIIEKTNLENKYKLSNE